MGDEKAAARLAMRLVLVERGARDVRLREGTAGDVVVIAQGADLPAEFAARALARVSLLLSQRRCIAEALVSVSEGQGREAGIARAIVARALALHMFATGGGTIVFGASAVVDAALRHQLLALADVLVDETGGSVVAVTVRFGAPLEPALAEADDEAPPASMRRPRRALPRPPAAPRLAG
jgi:hypothetical protein